MVTLVTPPNPGANSYANSVDADEYVATYVLDDSLVVRWNAKSDDDKAKLLIVATQRLDQFMSFVGRKTYFDQVLEWPRIQVYIDDFYLDPAFVPLLVKRATVAMALWLLQNGGAEYLDAQTQFKNITVGPIKVDFNDNAGITPRQFIPDDVIALLERVGTYQAPYNGSGMKVARLVR